MFLIDFPSFTLSASRSKAVVQADPSGFCSPKSSLDFNSRHKALVPSYYNHISVTGLSLASDRKIKF